MVLGRGDGGAWEKARAEGLTGIGHVVDEDGNFILHVSNQHHAAHDIRSRPLLVDKGECCLEAVGDACSTFRLE